MNINFYKQRYLFILRFQMKGILVILDGLGDLPLKQLGDKTPLEAAEMPNLDFLANRGQMGYMYSVRPGFVPESDEAVVSIFGNDLESSSRGEVSRVLHGFPDPRSHCDAKLDESLENSLKSEQI